MATIFKSNDDGKLYTIAMSRGHYSGLLHALPYNHSANYKKSANRRVVKLSNFTEVGHR